MFWCLPPSSLPMLIIAYPKSIIVSGVYNLIEHFYLAKYLNWIVGRLRASSLKFSMCSYSTSSLQVVLTSTKPSELCINGMSFSRRASRWANSALVVTVSVNDFIALNFHGPLAGIEFQVVLYMVFLLLEQVYRLLG